jgi:hypothetical protein
MIQLISHWMLWRELSVNGRWKTGFWTLDGYYICGLGLEPKNKTELCTTSIKQIAVFFSRPLVASELRNKQNVGLQWFILLYPERVHCDRSTSPKQWLKTHRRVLRNAFRIPGSNDIQASTCKISSQQQAVQVAARVLKGV